MLSSRTSLPALGRSDSGPRALPPATYYRRAREIRESSHSPDRKQAERLLKKRLAELGAERLGVKTFGGAAQERLTVGELLDGLEAHYRNQSMRTPQVLSHLRPIREAFGDRRAVAVTAEAVEKQIAAWLDEGRAPSTINRRTQLLGQAFRLAVKGQRLSAAPNIPRLSEQGNAREGFFERAEFEAAVAYIRERDPDVADFLDWFYWTGMRPGSIRALEWPALDRETWTLRLPARSEKIRQGRALALEGPLRDIIRRRIAARRLDCPLIFHRQRQPMGEFRKLWKAACRAVGVDGRLPYDLRWTALRNMRRAGVSETVAMRISGHRTRSTFDRYNITSDADLQDAVRKTAEYVLSLPAEAKVIPMARAARE